MPTDVSGEYIGPYFKGQAVQQNFFGCLILKDKAGWPATLVTNCQIMPPQTSQKKAKNLSLVVFIFIMT